MVNKRMYITTAIAYLNGEPHIGHALEIIQADCLARFYRLLGNDLVFQTGADEHGIKIFNTAMKNNIEVHEFIEKYYQLFIKLYKTLGISNDRYVRTTSEIHKKGASKLWKKMVENGDLYKAHYSGTYCVGCEVYKTANELVDGKCPFHPNRELIQLEEENYFFKLTKYINKLIEIYEKDEILIVPTKRKAEVLSLLKSGELADVSFSRQKAKMPWGIPVPNDEEHVMYVWADALSNYITNIGYEYDEKEFNSIWPADIHLIGKDILKFHAIYWPAMLLSANIQLPKKLCIHGFVTLEGGKIGKSIGNVIDPFYLIDKYTVDGFRFYILKNIPSNDDGSFREKDLVENYNNSLADDLGNLVLRVFSFIQKDFNKQVPKLHELTEEDKNFIGNFNFVEELKDHVDNFRLNRALDRVWEFVKETNKYINETEPWKIKKQGKIERYSTVLYILYEALRVISIYIQPFTPIISERIQRIIGCTSSMDFSDVSFKRNTTGKIGEKEILFPKISMKKTVDPLQFFDFKVGKIVEIEDHPNSDDIYILKMNVGEKIISICAKIAKYYEKEELMNKKLAVLINIEPREIKGVKSEGLLLGAFNVETNKMELATIEGEPGEQIYIDDLEPEPRVISGKQFHKTKILTQDNNIKIGMKFLQTKKKKVQINLRNGIRLK
ncbi:MAG: methionine--tRNA ligase [Candidatus Helarchaeota archaeon]